MPASRLSFACFPLASHPSMCPLGDMPRPCPQGAPDALVVVEAVPLCRDDPAADEVLARAARGAGDALIDGEPMEGDEFRGFAVMPCSDALEAVRRLSRSGGV